MSWAAEGVRHLRKKSPEGYDVVKTKYVPWYGIVLPKEFQSFSPFFHTYADDIQVIGFLIDPLGRVFFKATDIPLCYGYIEEGRINDFFASTYCGSSSFCTITTVRAAFCEGFFARRTYDTISIRGAGTLLEWLFRFEILVDKDAFKRHQMFRVAMTKDGRNASHLVPDPSVPCERKTSWGRKP